MTRKPARLQPYREVIPDPDPQPAASHELCMNPDCVPCWSWLCTFADVQDPISGVLPQIAVVELDDATHAALAAAAGRDARIEDVARDVLREWAEGKARR